MLREHKRELSLRKKRRQPVREGWDAGLRLVAEECDLASVGGPRGLLALTERLKASYPHITSLYLNAGLAAFTSLNWGRFIGQVIMDGYAYATSHPVYMNERVGWVTADGRGVVWSTNTLAPYILVRELMPLLRRSPKGLPFSPRVVYTSSCTASLDHLVPEPLHDYQLLEYEQTYSPSKYMADLIFCELDREYGSGKDPASTAPASIEDHDIGRNRDELQDDDEPEDGEGQRQVRCLLADPGCVATNINRTGFGGGLFQRFMWFLNWIAFYLVSLPLQEYSSLTPGPTLRLTVAPRLRHRSRPAHALRSSHRPPLPSISKYRPLAQILSRGHSMGKDKGQLWRGGLLGRGCGHWTGADTALRGHSERMEEERGLGMISRYAHASDHLI